jgi:hypothetical protein
MDLNTKKNTGKLEPFEMRISGPYRVLQSEIVQGCIQDFEKEEASPRFSIVFTVNSKNSLTYCKEEGRSPPAPPPNKSRFRGSKLLSCLHVEVHNGFKAPRFRANFERSKYHLDSRIFKNSYFAIIDIANPENCPFSQK